MATSRVAARGRSASRSLKRKTHRARRQIARKVRGQQTGPELVEQLFRQVRDAVGKQRAAMAGQRRPVGRPRRTRVELYEIARKRGLAGRSKMTRDELARKLRLR